MYIPCEFNRNEYLAHEKQFEAIKIELGESELCEFNDDAGDLAVELAYTRYALAKAEKEIETLKTKSTKE